MLNTVFHLFSSPIFVCAIESAIMFFWYMLLVDEEELYFIKGTLAIIT